MTLIVGDTVRMVCKMRDESNSLIENRYYIRHTGLSPVSDGDFLNQIESELSYMYNFIEGYMPNTLESLEIECDKVYMTGGKVVTLGPVGTIAWTTWAGGTSAAERLPEGVAAVVNFPTDIPRTQGRKFLGPMTEGANADGSLDPALMLNLINFSLPLNALWLVDSQEFTPGIMSYKAEGLVPTPTFVIPSIWGYQRRRKPGVGV